MHQEVRTSRLVWDGDLEACLSLAAKASVGETPCSLPGFLPRSDPIEGFPRVSRAWRLIPLILSSSVSGWTAVLSSAPLLLPHFGDCAQSGCKHACAGFRSNAVFIKSRGGSAEHSTHLRLPQPLLCQHLRAHGTLAAPSQGHAERPETALPWKVTGSPSLSLSVSGSSAGRHVAFILICRKSWSVCFLSNIFIKFSIY